MTRRMNDLEQKIDRLLLIFERFEPFLDKLAASKTIPNFIRRTYANRD